MINPLGSRFDNTRISCIEVKIIAGEGYAYRMPIALSFFYCIIYANLVERCRYLLFNINTRKNQNGHFK